MATRWQRAGGARTVPAVMPRTARARVGCLQRVALDPAAVDSLFPAPRPGSFRCQDITACVGLGVAKSDERQDARLGPIASQGVAGHAPAQIFGKHWPAMHRDDPCLRPGVIRHRGAVTDRETLSSFSDCKLGPMARKPLRSSARPIRASQGGACPPMAMKVRSAATIAPSSRRARVPRRRQARYWL